MPSIEMDPVCAPLSAQWPVQDVFGELGEEDWCGQPLEDRWEEETGPGLPYVLAPVCSPMGGMIVWHPNEAAGRMVQFLRFREGLILDLSEPGQHNVMMRVRPPPSAAGSDGWVQFGAVNVNPAWSPTARLSFYVPQDEMTLDVGDGFGVERETFASYDPDGAEAWFRFEFLAQETDPTQLRFWTSAWCGNWTQRGLPMDLTHPTDQLRMEFLFNAPTPGAVGPGWISEIWVQSILTP